MISGHLTDAMAMSVGTASGQASSVVLNSPLCYGNETFLLECPGAVFLTTPSCQASSDAGVICNERQCKDYLLYHFCSVSVCHYTHDCSLPFERRDICC